MCWNSFGPPYEGTDEDGRESLKKVKVAISNLRIRNFGKSSIQLDVEYMGIVINFVFSLISFIAFVKIMAENGLPRVAIEGLVLFGRGMKRIGEMCGQSVHLLEAGPKGICISDCIYTGCFMSIVKPCMGL